MNSFKRGASKSLPPALKRPSTNKRNSVSPSPRNMVPFENPVSPEAEMPPTIPETEMAPMPKGKVTEKASDGDSGSGSGSGSSGSGSGSESEEGSDSGSDE